LYVRDVSIDRWATTEGRYEGAKAEKARAVPALPPFDPTPFFAGHRSGGITMNTAVARRLALGDRIMWIGKDGYQPTGLGTIIRITAHEVEVRWDSDSLKRYRRAHLHNIRHVKLISETVETRRQPHNHVESVHFREKFARYVRQRARQDHDTLLR
jgi:hypothetical protein